MLGCMQSGAALIGAHNNSAELAILLRHLPCLKTFDWHVCCFTLARRIRARRAKL